MIKKYIIVLLFLILIYVYALLTQYELFDTSPCRDSLTDREYLDHMIPHHQVAVDISKLLQKKSKSPFMQSILKKLIWTQEYEINLMKNMINRLPTNNSVGENITNYTPTIADFTKPNKLGLTSTYCDPNFFNPEEHMKHLEHMELNEKTYLEHMIPHHQVAVDMSKKLLKHTNNKFMIYLCYRIIRSQQEEIVMLNDMLNNKNYFHESNLLL
tara:strand:+ start:416 stop:1054 length:639 start_codon:yes stop_codon:yes gene_type:complete